MIKILFVDDEPNVLEGLQRMLRSMRREWEMAFAGGAAEALEALAAARFDVVVTDMRMPGMDGAELLHRVMREHPHLVRIILSGHADQEMALRSVGAAHQYLSKPCDAEALKRTVERACAGRGLLADEGLRQLVSRLSALPSLPALYTQLLDELQSAQTTVKRVGEIISMDVGMTAKILQMVNSAFFGLGRPLTSPGEAVGYLGLDRVKALVLSIQVFSEFKADGLPGFSPARLWAHSLMAGKLAETVAKTARTDPPMSSAEAFTAGLLHDTGKLVLAARLPEYYGEAINLARAEGVTPAEAERRVFGVTQAEVGGYLLGLWGLPPALVDAVAFHDRPRERLADGCSTLTAVHVADALLAEAEAAGAAQGCVALDEEYLAHLNLTDRLPAWREAAAALRALEE
jgi:HD-like signal output (HDOD) protein/ActR/RegA family two-component response regulator